MHKPGQNQTFPLNDENIAEAREGQAARLARPQALACTVVNFWEIQTWSLRWSL